MADVVHPLLVVSTIVAVAVNAERVGAVPRVVVEQRAPARVGHHVEGARGARVLDIRFDLQHVAVVVHVLHAQTPELSRVRAQRVVRAVQPHVYGVRLGQREGQRAHEPTPHHHRPQRTRPFRNRRR